MVLALLLSGEAVCKLALFEPDAVYPAIDPGVPGWCAETRAAPSPRVRLGECKRRRVAMTSGGGVGAELPIRGQAALVTGGGRGLGRAMAIALSSAGAGVAVCSRSSSELAETVRQIATRGGRATAIETDVRDRRSVEGLVEQAEHELGPLDVLVNNAGVSGPLGPIAETDPDAWWETLEINLRGPLYCSRAVLPGMLARGRGRIINISSGAGLRTWPMATAYAVSKAALQHLTENLAAETQGRGVSVFTVLPGLVRTRLAESGINSDVPSISNLFRTLLDQGLDLPPERPAELVVFLASGKADELSGRFFDANQPEADMMRRMGEIRERNLYAFRADMA
jgi:NAD(P)-dependent dehydrogenase (short-subunit alcohol dehydrogenase family)